MMKKIILTLPLFLATVTALAQDKAPGKDEELIRQAIASYVDAFNSADAKKLAAHWGEQGELVAPGGKEVRGRQQLEAEFTAYFAESKGAEIELADTKVELLSPNVATETGIARVLIPENEPSETEYLAIHVKTPGGWKIDSIRESAVAAAPPSHFEQLQALDWMIGQWTDADGKGAIETTCQWTSNRNYITRSFKLFVEGRVDFAGTQVIGWDPAAQTIRSWLFDSDGGFAVGRWTGEGQRWVAKTLSVLPDGRRASSTNIYELVDENTLNFQSIGRQVDGELLPNVGPVQIVRKNEN